MTPQVNVNIPLPMDAIRAFCQRWGVRELALFGSVLREDFRPNSDIDVLVTFADGSGITMERLTAMTEELEAVFGHSVDLMTRSNVEKSDNYIIRREVLRSAQVIYAA